MTTTHEHLLEPGMPLATETTSHESKYIGLPLKAATGIIGLDHARRWNLPGQYISMAKAAIK